ncbi:MAG: hypothetical protein ACLTKE_03780 [Coprococcus sp.]
MKALEDAYKDLQNKPVDPENPELEKARKALETKLAEAKGIDQNLYTEETSRAFQKAIDNAEAVLADEKASLEALNGAFNGLVSAMDRLEEKGEIRIQIGTQNRIRNQIQSQIQNRIKIHKNHRKVIVENHR